MKGGFAAGRGAIRFAKYGRKLSNDVAAGVLTVPQQKNYLPTVQSKALPDRLAP